jgi:hypothetical protein
MKILLIILGIVAVIAIVIFAFYVGFAWAVAKVVEFFMKLFGSYNE